MKFELNCEHVYTYIHSVLLSLTSYIILQSVGENGIEKEWFEKL